MWLAPPCWSHSAVQNGRKGGPLRSKEFPEGVDREHPVVKLGSTLCERALEIFTMCIRLGILATIEHPRTSYAWRMMCTKSSLKNDGVHLSHIDLCNFPEVGRPLTRKPTTLLTTQPWIHLLPIRCPGNHCHAPHLCGSKAKEAAQYSISFAQAVAQSYEGWRKAQA